MTEAVIISGARTAIGNFGGALQEVPAAKLGSIVIREALKRAGVRPKADAKTLSYAPEKLKDTGLIELEKKNYNWDNSLRELQVDEVIMGNVLQAGQGQNPARQASIYAGLPKEASAFTVNKICASGMKAVALATQAIRLGDADIIVAGGMENMSLAPYYVTKARWGARMNNTEMVDGMVYDGLYECFYNYHMGITSENIAEKYGISRTEQDAFALESNLRAAAAIKAGMFKEEIVPVEIVLRREVKLFDTDEHPRADCSMEALGKLSSAFRKDGTITAGNASAITDGAAALLIISDEKARQLGLKPLATIRSYAAGGVDPAYMGLGVVPAARKALNLAKLSLKDINAIELNEAFASQSIGVIRELGIDMAKTNPYGGGISLGHPIGCSGARIIVTLLHEMKRKNLRFGLATLCIGGGQGMAVVLERN
ncbi:MAG: acetyl-CoA C-acetyltransferase [Chloroflexi bacterium]|nr:acetyl-CoA C-acetyltransferase [Chloroflexota bacterium]